MQIDTRRRGKRERPAPGVVFSEATGLFLVLCVRVGSLNGIDEALRKRARRMRWHTWMGGDLPSADRLGEVAALLDLDDVRALLYDHHKQRKHNAKQCCCHDIEGLTSWTQLGHQVRVVRCEKSSIVRRQRSKEEESITSKWLWATSLSKEQADTRMIVRIGHTRPSPPS